MSDNQKSEVKTSIIIVLIGALILCWVLWPKVPVKVQQQIDPHLEAIAKLNDTIVILKAQNTTILKKATQDSVKSARREIAYKRVLKGAQDYRDSTRAAVQPLIDSIPALQMAFAATDSVNTVQKQENDSLRNDLRIAQLTIRDLSVNQDQVEKAFYEMIDHQQRIIDIQGKALKKVHRKGVVQKVVGGALIGVALWIGTKLD